MKAYKLVFAAMVLALIATACGSSGNGTPPPVDSATANTDTVKSDPSKFSDPH